MGFGSIAHNPRCNYLKEPPTLRDPSDCNCGAIPPIPGERPRPMPKQSINQSEIVSVTATEAKVTRVTIKMTAELAALIRVAIGSAGDGGVDPFNEIQRAQLGELDRQLYKVTKDVIV